MSANDTASLEVILPSRGVRGLYGDKLPGGKVRIRKWQMKELRVLESSGLSMHERVRKILDTCIILPEGVKPDELLMTDRFAALLFQRSYTFGTTEYLYDFRCSECGQTNRKVVCDVVADFNETPATDDLAEPIEVELADAKITVQVRFLRGADEVEVVKRAKFLKMKSQDAEDSSSMVRIARSIKSIDGNPVSLEEAEMRVALLSARDVNLIRLAIEKVEPSIDTTLHPLCKHCGAEAELEMPMTQEFFRPSRL